MPAQPEWVVGIDPGAKGAICALSSSGDLQFYDMPATIPEWKQLGSFLRSLKPVALHIENVHSLHGMSAKSNFTFGGWVRMINLVAGLALNKWPDLIQPKRWQADVGLSFPKGSTTKERKALAAEHALKLWPTVREYIYGPKGGLKDGRVDAFLIAYNLMCWRRDAS